MSITFFLDDQRQPTAVTAKASMREVAAFRDFARTQGARPGLDLVPDFDAAAPSFDVRVCPLALATITAHFAAATDVVRVVDDAQFLGRRVRFTRNPDTGFDLTVSQLLDAEPDINISDESGRALLEALGLDVESVGEIPIGELRRRLEDRDSRDRLRRHRLLDRAMQLAQLIAVGEQHELTRVIWG